MRSNGHLPCKFFLPVLIVLSLANCRQAKDKGRYWHTAKLDNGLYVEVYKTFSQGALGSDLVDDYLTDSLNFRVRIGTSDEYYEQVYYKPIEGDSILIRRSRRSDDLNGEMKPVKSDVYSLKELRKLQNAAKTETVNIDGR